MTSKEAEESLSAKKREHEQAQRALNAKRLELAAARSKDEPLQTELARIAALPQVTSADLVAQTNAERRLAQLQGEVAELGEQANALEAEATAAAAAAADAGRGVETALFSERLNRLMKRAGEVEAEFSEEVSQVLSEAKSLGIRDGVIARLLQAADGLRSPLIAVGEALHVLRESQLADHIVRRMNTDLEDIARLHRQSREKARAARSALPQGRVRTFLERFKRSP